MNKLKKLEQRQRIDRVLEAMDDLSLKDRFKVRNAMEKKERDSLWNFYGALKRVSERLHETDQTVGGE